VEVKEVLLNGPKLNKLRLVVEEGKEGTRDEMMRKWIQRDLKPRLPLINFERKKCFFLSFEEEIINWISLHGLATISRVVNPLFLFIVFLPNPPINKLFVLISKKKIMYYLKVYYVPCQIL